MGGLDRASRARAWLPPPTLAQRDPAWACGLNFSLDFLWILIIGVWAFWWRRAGCSSVGELAPRRVVFLEISWWSGSHNFGGRCCFSSVSCLFFRFVSFPSRPPRPPRRPRSIPRAGRGASRAGPAAPNLFIPKNGQIPLELDVIRPPLSLNTGLF